MTPLAGRVALVTGGARGLGRAIADRLTADGASVAVLDVVEEEPGPRDVGSSAAFFRADVTDEAEVSDAVAAVAEQLGGIDILVNNAGLLSGRHPFAETGKADLMRYLEVNVAGYLLTAQAARPHLIASRAGRIVNVASRTFFTGASGQVAYVASKGAVLGLTRVLATELGDAEVTVNAAMPGQVATPGTEAFSGPETFDATMRRQAIKRRVLPEHFAGLVAFLVGDDAAMITGQTFICDGGGHMH